MMMISGISRLPLFVARDPMAIRPKMAISSGNGAINWWKVGRAERWWYIWWFDAFPEILCHTSIWRRHLFFRMIIRMKTKMVMMMMEEQRPFTGFPELMSTSLQSTASVHLISSTFLPSIEGEQCSLNLIMDRPTNTGQVDASKTPSTQRASAMYKVQQYLYPYLWSYYWPHAPLPDH